MKLNLKDIDLTRVAERLLVQVERNIRASGHWHKTGRLLQSLKIQHGENGEVAVTVSRDRLEVPELMQKFQDEIIPDDLDGAALGAIKQAVRAALEIKGDK